MKEFCQEKGKDLKLVSLLYAIQTGRVSVQGRDEEKQDEEERKKGDKAKKRGEELLAKKKVLEVRIRKTSES